MTYCDRIPAVILTLATPFVMSGCAGVFNPYVKASGHPYSDPCWAPSQVQPAQTFTAAKNGAPPPQPITRPASDDTACLLPDAIRWAHATRTAYQDAMGNDAWLDTGVPSLLIGAAGILTFQGVTGVSTSVVTRTAVIAGSAGGIASYLRNRPKTLIYGASAEAIGCALGAVSPLLMTPAAMTRLAKERDAAIQSVVKAKTWIRDNASTKDAQLKTKLAAVQKEADDLQALIDDASAGLFRVRQAGPGLISAVDRIIAETDRQLANSLPNPQAIANGLGGLSLVAGTPDAVKKQLGDVAESPATADAMKKPMGAPAANGAAEAAIAGDGVLGELRKGTHSASVLQEYRYLAKQEALDAALRACRVEPRVKAVDVFPPTTRLEFSADKDGSLVLDIVGGAPPYTVDVSSGSPGNALSARVESRATGMTLVIQKTGKLPANTEVGLILRSATVSAGEAGDVSRKSISIAIK